MKIAICDNEECFCEFIKNALESLEDENIIDCYNNGNDLLAEMDAKQYDIAYLDIEMPGINGLDVAEKIRQVNRNIIVIFVSSYTCYITKAFRLNAFQFLVKDASKEDIIVEYNRAKVHYTKVHYLYTLKQNTEVKKIEINNIAYIESQNRHLYLNTVEGIVYEYRGKLDKEEEKLKLYNFVRIHESFLVNMALIKSINSDRIILDCKQNKEMPISRKFKEKVLNKYNIYSSGCSI